MDVDVIQLRTELLSDGTGGQVRESQLGVAQPPTLTEGPVEDAASMLVAQAVAQGKGETVTDPDILRRLSEIVQEVNRRQAA